MLREIFMSEEHREMKKYFLSSLGNIGQIRHFKKGEHIAPDEFRDCFKVVMKGMIKLGLISQNGEYRLFHLMRPGEVYDEYPKFDQDEFEIIAEEDCDVQFFRFNDIRQLRQPEKCLEYLLCSMHRKYSLLKFQALCVQFDDIQGKLVGLILRTAYQCGNMTAEGECMLDYAFTHEEMASIVGCSRVTVTRHLKRLKETGLIDVRHRRIVVKNAEALEKLTAVR